jgi:hypothetical protein
MESRQLAVSSKQETQVSKYREFLEKQIIAAAFFFPAAALEASSILNAPNFALKISRQLFQIIRHCMDHGLNTTDAYIREFWNQHPDTDPAQLMAFLEAHFQGENVREKCLLLIEMDMREKFGEALRQNELLAVANQDFERADMWKQCADYLADPKKDIFEAIPQVKRYLANYATEELEAFIKLEASIPKMVDRVKGTERARRLIDTLTGIAASPDIEPDRAECIEILKDLLIQCISRLPIPNDLNHTLTLLRSNQWQVPLKSPSSPSF